MRLDKKKFSFTKIKDTQIIKKMVDVVNKDGFYLALFICFCIITAAAVWTVKNNIQEIENISDKNNIELVKEQDNYDRTVAEENAQPVQGEQALNEPQDPVVISESFDKSPVEKEAVSHSKPKETKVLSSKPVLAMPVEGPICLGYADNTLVYSKTLDQYIVHRAIDIEAPLNTPVCAAADGTVIKVDEDEKMGITIWIEHENDLVTVYSNLSTTEMVSLGDVVKQGDVISGVGDTALFEILEVPHLHFEVLNNGKNENPENYLKIEHKDQNE